MTIQEIIEDYKRWLDMCQTKEELLGALQQMVKEIQYV